MNIIPHCTAQLHVPIVRRTFLHEDHEVAVGRREKEWASTRIDDERSMRESASEIAGSREKERQMLWRSRGKTRCSFPKSFLDYFIVVTWRALFLRKRHNIFISVSNRLSINRVSKWNENSPDKRLFRTCFRLSYFSFRRSISLLTVFLFSFRSPVLSFVSRSLGTRLVGPGYA